MEIRRDFAALIGDTPLLRLRRASEETGCEILGKAEFANPGGSVKDRAALYIVRDALARGALRPGGVLVEGTAGNTGIGLALLGNSHGYRSLVVMPDNQSREKMEMLRLCGAELRLVPPVPYANPENYVHVARRLAEAIPGAYFCNQFDNTANREAHYETTGPEIWRQTAGNIHAFTCAVGTGGTLAGVGRFLKERNPAIRIVLTDPMGSALYNGYAHGELKAEGSSITEGIGQGRITRNLEGAQVDDWQRVSDEEALPVLYALVREEGLVLGGSSGINVAGAVALARKLGPGHAIVTMLCDAGFRYQSRLFNPAFLRERHLPMPDWLP